LCLRIQNFEKELKEEGSKKGNKNFKKKKEKRKRGGGGGRDTLILPSNRIHPHTFFASRLFLQTPSKALRNGPARGIKDERSYFAAHRPSRDSNRELVLGVVLFGCVVSSREIFEFLVSRFAKVPFEGGWGGICDRLSSIADALNF